MRGILGLFVFGFFMQLAFVACNNSSRDDAASKAAVAYYQCLIDGKYEEFVDGIAYSDSMTECYRSQMVDMMAQHAAIEKELRGGMVSVKAVSDTIVENAASVFLEVTYADSTCEEISVPMTLCGEDWKMQ